MRYKPPNASVDCFVRIGARLNSACFQTLPTKNIGVISAARRRRFRLLPCQQHSGCTQSRPRFGPYPFKRPLNSADKTFVPLLWTHVVELVFQELGWQVRSLGSNLPLEFLEPAIEQLRPGVCWVSVSHVDSDVRLAEQLSFLAECG